MAYRFKFNGLPKKTKILKQQIHAINAALLARNMAAGTTHPVLDGHIDVNDAVRRMQKKHDKFYGNTSKYRPHQGTKERLRRRTKPQYVFGNHIRG